MALGTNHQTITTAAAFIPELWSDEVIAAHKSNLVVAPLVTSFDFKGKKGDTLHLPVPARGSANAKVAETQVTLNTDTATDLSILVNKHFEYSIVFEDLMEIQALASSRQFYTNDAGYQLAKQQDSDLIALAATWNSSTDYSTAVIGSDGVTVYDPSANTNTGNGAALADAGIRKIARTLDDLDVPMTGRVWVIPPVEKQSLLGVDRFTEQAFTGEEGSGNSIRTGLVGDLYGTEVYVTSNCATTTADDTTTDYRVALYFHKGQMALAEQQAIRSQSQYIQQYLGTLFTADVVYGVKNLRADNGIAVVVPE